MSGMFRAVKVVLGVAVIGALGACQQAQSPSVATATAPSVFKPTAGVQDIMAHVIDPSADFLWEAVSSTVTAAGVEEKQPRTDEEWKEVRRHAIIVTEAANLLLVDGRRVTSEGGQLEDHGTPGNLTAEQAEQAIAADRATFVAFSHALHDAGALLLKAADERNIQGLVDGGEALDEACEACHVKFWYPGQVLPKVPTDAPAPNAN